MCSMEECHRPTVAGGLCNAHYLRLRRHGSPLGGRKTHSISPMSWLLAHREHTGAECLIWPYSTIKGYGRIVRHGKPELAHRVMCGWAWGEPPTQKHQCAHSCGNGHLGCVNPHHLRWATASENQLDRANHGTDNRGEKHPLSKLTEAAVREIRRRSGDTHTTLSREFGVTIGAIRHVRNGFTWGHVV